MRSRLHLSCFLALCSLFHALNAPLRAEGEVEYLDRAGLFSGPEFTSSFNNYQESYLDGLTDSGYMRGRSTRFDGSNTAGYAAWATDANTGTTARIGLYSGAEFTRTTGNEQISEAFYLSESGYLSGRSERYSGAAGAGYAAWVANAATGATTRVGLYDGAEYTSTFNNYQESHAYGPTETGLLRGVSYLYSEANNAGQAAWVADASTGATTRIGLFSGSEFTSTANNYQSSYVDSITESGFLRGSSSRYDGADFEGHAAWVADATSGATRRIGFFSGAEYINSSNGYQFSAAESLTESGLLRGTSARFSGENGIGHVSWVADASTGTTTRVGLFAGAEFTRSSDNYQYSYAQALTESGFLIGSSNRYSEANDSGGAAWVANAATGVTTRIGFYAGAEYTSTTDNYQNSSASSLTESGFLMGSSERFSGANGAGHAAWIADAFTGVTTRVGLFAGAEYTSTTNNYQYSYAQSLIENGYLIGTSNRYSGASSAGAAAWVANAATGVTTRVGLYAGAEYTRTTANSFQSSSVSTLTESGFLMGASNRYSGVNPAGQAAWVANASTGATTRIGLFTGAEYTSTTNNFQNSSASSITESGFLTGTSYRYNGANDAGRASWVADASTGSTMRVGLYDQGGGTVFTGTGNYQNSAVTHFTEEGLVAGYSRRYNGNAGADGQTAWIFDLTTDTQIAFELSVRPSDGRAYSTITGITGDGMAYGYYTLYNGETNLGERAFLWSADFGTLLLDEAIAGGVEQYGWDFLSNINWANSEGVIAGNGRPYDGSGSQAIFMAQAVPEPGPAALIILGLGALALRRRMRRG